MSSRNSEWGFPFFYVRPRHVSLLHVVDDCRLGFGGHRDRVAVRVVVTPETLTGGGHDRLVGSHDGRCDNIWFHTLAEYASDCRCHFGRHRGIVDIGGVGMPVLVPGHSYDAPPKWRLIT